MNPSRFLPALITGLTLSLSAHAGQLFVLTGNGGSPAETLFTVNKTTAATTLFLTLGNGNDGDTITFNPLNRLFYHASGGANGTEFFETVDPVSLTVGPNLAPAGTYSSPTGTAASVGEIFGMAFYPPTGKFLATDINSNLFTVELNGGFTLIGNSTDDYRGLAIVGPKVYAIDPYKPFIVRLDPATGTVAETIPLLVDGTSNAARGGNSLVYDSDTGVVYGIVQSPDTMVAKSARFLATVNLATGAATMVGPLPAGSASLAVLLNKVVPPPAVVPPGLKVPAKLSSKGGKATIKGSISGDVSIVQVKAGKGGFKKAKIIGGKFSFKAKGLPAEGTTKVKVRATSSTGQSVTKKVKITAD